MLKDVNRSVPNHQHAYDAAEATLVAEERRLEIQLADVRDILTKIRATRAGSLTNEVADLPPVTPKQFAGMRVPEGLATYLKGRQPFKIPIERAVKDLLAGDLYPGIPHSKKDPSPERNMDHKLRIAIQCNPKVFQFDEKSDEVWLAPGAIERPKKRKKYKPRGT